MSGQTDLVRNEVERKLDACEVRKQKWGVSGDPTGWWEIVHVPTGKTCDGPRRKVQHPQLPEGVGPSTVMGVPRWRAKRDAQKVLDTLRAWASEGVEYFAERYFGGVECDNINEDGIT